MIAEGPWAMALIETVTPFRSPGGRLARQVASARRTWPARAAQSRECTGETLIARVSSGATETRVYAGTGSVWFHDIVGGCAPGRIRTCDTGFRRAVLYPLSYEGGGTS